MAELATIARPYAQALFEVAEGGGAQQTAAQLDALAALAADDRLRQFASNPKVADAQVFDLMTAVAGTPLSDSVRNLLRTVLVNAHSGMSDAIVYSAYPIDNAQLGDVVATLEKRSGRKLHATVQLAPELIGGIRVVVGDEVLDTSVAARLQQMKMALAA